MVIGELVQGSSVKLGAQRLKRGVPPEVLGDGSASLAGNIVLQEGEYITVREHGQRLLLATFGYPSFSEGLVKKGFG